MTTAGKMGATSGQPQGGRIVRGRRRSYDINQARIAVIAAVITLGLVSLLILAMGFVDYQGRLARYQPDIRTSDIIDTVNAKAELDVSFPKFLESSQLYRKTLEKLQEQQASIGYRIERVCSRFEPIDAAADFYCRKFLRHAPFDGTISQASTSPDVPLTRDLKDLVVRSLAEKMRGYFKINGEEADFIKLYSNDIIFIANANHQYFTELISYYERRANDYTDQCIRIVNLLTLIGHQGYRMPNCDLTGSLWRAVRAGDPAGRGAVPPKTLNGAAPTGPGAVAVPSDDANLADAKLADAKSSAASTIDQVATGRPDHSANGQGDTPSTLRSSTEGILRSPSVYQVRFDLVNQFEIYDLIPFRISRLILLSSPEFVAQLLLMIGGALGAMLKILFWHLLPTRSIKWTDLIIEPAQGCVCAVILFVLFRSGVVLVTGGEKIDGSTLSPYFIAFVAIGGGLLSDNVIAALRRAAESLIGKAETRLINRWGVGLKMAFAAASQGPCPGVSPSMAAARLGIAPDRLASWIRMEQPVDGDSQTKLALLLGVPAYELFTDIKPSSLEDEEATDQATSDAATSEPKEELRRAEDDGSGST